MRAPALASPILGLALACGGKAPASSPPLVVGDGDGVTAPATADAGAAAATGPALPPPPAGFERAALVTLSDGAVTAYAIGAGGLTALGKAQLGTAEPDSPFDWLSGDWADHERLFVWIPERRVVEVTAAGIREVTVPPPAAFKTPRPTVDDDDGLTEGGVMEESGSGLVVQDGSAWWSECPWGFPYDGWQCEVHVSARLWPDAAVVGDAVAARTWTWPGAQPRGFRVEEVDEAQGLRCTPPPGAGQKPHVFRARTGEDERIYASHWVAVTPPRLLVVYGMPGMDDLIPTRWSLHDGCRPASLAQGTTVVPGPDGLWLAWESPDPLADEPVARPVIRRGADVVGEVPGDLVRFRPPAPTAP